MNAAEALEALERERFGCMVLDFSLPDMDGLELCSKSCGPGTAPTCRPC